jgi:hypothetical protein
MGRPPICNCLCGKCYITSFIISIYDESEFIYTDPEQSLYDEDLLVWNNFIDEVKNCSGQKIRMGLMIPGGTIGGIKYAGSDLPYDTDRDQINAVEYPITGFNEPRLTSDQIISFFELMLNDPYSEIYAEGPKLLLFVLDNSGSITIESYAQELQIAKNFIKSTYPDITILDDVSNAGERWINDSYLGIQNKICKYTCCNETCFQDISLEPYNSIKDRLCGLTEDEFNIVKSKGGTVKICKSGLSSRYASSQLEIESSLSSMSFNTLRRQSCFENNVSNIINVFYELSVQFNGTFTGTYPGILPVSPNQTFLCSLNYSPSYLINTIPISGTYTKPHVLQPLGCQISQPTLNYNGIASLYLSVVSPTPSLSLFCSLYVNKAEYDTLYFGDTLNLRMPQAISINIDCINLENDDICNGVFNPILSNDYFKSNSVLVKFLSNPLGFIDPPAIFPAYSSGTDNIYHFECFKPPTFNYLLNTSKSCNGVNINMSFNIERNSIYDY